MNKPVKISLKDINMMVTWDYKKECKLCRKSLQAPPPDELNVDKKLEITGEIVVGECDSEHMFHKKCMDNFVSQGYSMCPTDKLPWKQQKIIYSNAICKSETVLTMKSK